MKIPFILGLAGSPSRSGHTTALLESFLAGADRGGGKTELYHLAEMDIEPCRGCYSCRQAGWCVVGDEFQILFDRIKKAQIITLASPVFFGGLTAQAKTVVDRCQVFWVATHYRGESLIPPGKRTGVLLSTKGSSGEKNFSGILVEARAFFAVIEAPLTETILIPGMEADPSIPLSRKEIKRAEALGYRLVKESLSSEKS